MNQERISYQISRKVVRKTGSGYIELGFTHEVVWISSKHLEMAIEGLRAHRDPEARRLAEELAQRILVSSAAPGASAVHPSGGGA